MSSLDINRVFKASVTAAGLDPKSYSLHSLRRGGATLAFQCGVSSLLIQRHGDWTSDAYLDYITLPLTERFSLSRALASKISLN